MGPVLQEGGRKPLYQETIDAPRPLGVPDFAQLKQWGFFLRPVIQIDPTGAWDKDDALEERAKELILLNIPRRARGSCDHDCTLTNGFYKCDYAKSANRPVDLTTAAPVDEVYKGLVNSAEALMAHRRVVFQDREVLAERLGYSVDLTNLVADQILNGPVMVNLFAEPTRYRDILNLIQLLNKDEKGRFLTTLTTTGIKFLNSGFYKEFLENPSDVVALSLDDVTSLSSLGEMERLADLAATDKNGFLKEYQKLGRPIAQRHKAFEAIFTAALFKNSPGKPELLFNTVIHQGNLHNIFELMSLMRKLFPNAKINPYPAQSAHEVKPEDRKVNFISEDLPQMEKLVDFLIERQIMDDPGYTSRLPYLLFWKSLIVANRNDPEMACRMLSGFDAWRCYEDPLASSTLQIGAAEEVGASFPYPGMNTGCSWERTIITDPSFQVSRSSVARTLEYLQHGMRRLSFTSDHDCTCIMPRILGSEDSIVGGMDSKLRSTYMQERSRVLE